MVFSRKAGFWAVGICYLSVLAMCISCSDRQSRDALAQDLRDQDYEAIAARLNSPNTTEKCAAANAIAWVRDPALAQIHITLLPNSVCDWKTRIEAAWRLAESDYTDAINDVQQLLSDKDSRVRWNAAHVLGVWGQMESFERLRACEHNDTEGLVREWCAWAMCRISAATEENQRPCIRPVMELFRRPKPMNPNS